MKLGDRFDLVRLLGRGAMGEVHLAFDRLLTRSVAIKLMRADYQQDLEFAHRFFREAKIAARLRHPGIVGVHDFGRSEDGVCFLVLEYVAGETLEEVLAAGPVDEHAALPLLAALAQALAHAHAAGVIHRDLKPANVLCEDRDLARARIADFGLAKVIAEGHVTLQLTRRGSILGTPAYMAPEQAAGDVATRASDVYAWGCIAFHALVGRPAFVGTAGEVLRAQIATAPPPLSNVSPPLARVIERALDKDPSRRPPDGAALWSAVRALGAPPPRDDEALDALAASIVAEHAAPWVAIAWANVVEAADRARTAVSVERITELARAADALQSQGRRAAGEIDVASATVPSGSSTWAIEDRVVELRRRLAACSAELPDGDLARAELARARAELRRCVDEWLSARGTPGTARGSNPSGQA